MNDGEQHLRGVLLDAVIMLLTGALCGHLAAQIVTVREAMALAIGYGLCAIGVTIRDQVFR